MCIRDSVAVAPVLVDRQQEDGDGAGAVVLQAVVGGQVELRGQEGVGACLLYTSDRARRALPSDRRRARRRRARGHGRGRRGVLRGPDGRLSRWFPAPP